jgi:hypothetical protein
VKLTTRERLSEIEDVWGTEGRSTEYMIQYMQDAVGVIFECVMKYLESKGYPHAA